MCHKGATFQFWNSGDVFGDDSRLLEPVVTMPDKPHSSKEVSAHSTDKGPVLDGGWKWQQATKLLPKLGMSTGQLGQPEVILK
jgi:hypothetical protein